MSKQDKQRHLRRLVCEGCSLHCRYRDFRAFGPRAGGFASSPKKRDYAAEYRREQEVKAARAAGAPLPHGNAGKSRRNTSQQEFGEMARDARATNKTKIPVRRSKVLGRMHETKMVMWLHFTENCPRYGIEEE